ncbi:calcium-translocating P-type ATPase, PMCA-type [uncultured Methanosphaera sp.]|uniref:calcium-translocating P-type ATPase, PMCA-type n=1 Tax=uncultured Methanosphaera sp. TaxID=262501 RepID=UPI002595A518|nr:calcium-translocating P-type ATPase, PMCA-type [uncultured Methanosphaera sp.]
MIWEELTKSEVISKLNTTENGLTSDKATKNLEKYGKNALKEKEKESELKKFISQFTEPLMILLIIAGIIAAVIGDGIDSAVIFLVVILNAVIGYKQENKAENAMEKLKSMTNKTTIVLRDNHKQEINAEDLTVGDAVILEEGDSIPADLRLIETYDIKVDESSLTGESLPVHKVDCEVTDDSHDNMVFMNTQVVSGRAKGLVTSIGMNTEIGKIASMIQEEGDKQTPLEIKIDKLGKTLGLLAIIICVIIFVLELLQGQPVANTFMTAVSLAVAAIPEGLPAILTLTLALGMQKMAKNNVIIRKLLAVETLGSCSVVCTDKTGTLTHNKLTVTDSYTTDKNMAYIISGLCNNAKVDKDKNTKIGDPTDISALEYAINNNYSDNITQTRLHEIPLDSTRKRMTTINKINGKEYVLIKGAPEILLSMCKYIRKEDKVSEITTEEIKTIEKIETEYTDKALRVLLLAYKEIDDYSKYSAEELEEDLVFVGLIGMMDPPRKEVFDAIKTCTNAGITVKMITGDHKNTAMAIGKQVGIENPDKSLTGPEIDKLSDEEFMKVVKDVNIYARVFPEQKVRIVKALKTNNEIVSMTGDGVNDAPALTTANIGVAMGSGTDVAKESGDMILQDDNFSTIIYAIKEGRTIYSNIKRFLKYQLSTNIAAIITILTTTLLSLPIPFNPVQLLWINIIMDGPPAQSLGVEPADVNIMNTPPNNEDIVSKANLIHITLIGIVMTIGTLGLYLYEMSIGSNHTLASTIAFTVFVMYQLFNVFNCKSKSKEKNNTLKYAVIGSFILQLLVIYIPFLQTIFKTTAIPVMSWIPIIIVSALIIVAERIIRLFEKKVI